MAHWVILRMASARTLPLVASLKRAGVEVWTPTATVRQRRPRSDKWRDVTAAVLPTFAFADHAALGDLLSIAHSPASDHPAFTVFQHRGDVPTVAEAALQPLRDHEARLQEEWLAHLEALKRKEKGRRKRHAAKAYVLGQRVRVEREAFAGLVGEIREVRANGDLAIVFDSYTIGFTIPSCDVIPVQVNNGQPEQAPALVRA